MEMLAWIILTAFVSLAVMPMLASPFGLNYKKSWLVGNVFALFLVAMLLCLFGLVWAIGKVGLI